MRKSDLVERCNNYGLDSTGTIDVLLGRLKQHLFQNATDSGGEPPQTPLRRSQRISLASATESEQTQQPTTPHNTKTPRRSKRAATARKRDFKNPTPGTRTRPRRGATTSNRPASGLSFEERLASAEADERVKVSTASAPSGETPSTPPPSKPERSSQQAPETHESPTSEAPKETPENEQPNSTQGQSEPTGETVVQSSNVVAPSAPPVEAHSIALPEETRSAEPTQDTVDESMPSPPEEPGTEEQPPPSSPNANVQDQPSNPDPSSDPPMKMQSTSVSSKPAPLVGIQSLRAAPPTFGVHVTPPPILQRPISAQSSTQPPSNLTPSLPEQPISTQSNTLLSSKSEEPGGIAPSAISGEARSSSSQSAEAVAPSDKAPLVAAVTSITEVQEELTVDKHSELETSEPHASNEVEEENADPVSEPGQVVESPPDVSPKPDESAQPTGTAQITLDAAKALTVEEEPQPSTPQSAPPVEVEEQAQLPVADTTMAMEITVPEIPSTAVLDSSPKDSALPVAVDEEPANLSSTEAAPPTTMLVDVEAHSPSPALQAPDRQSAPVSPHLSPEGDGEEQPTNVPHSQMPMNSVMVAEEREHSSPEQQSRSSLVQPTSSIDVDRPLSNGQTAPAPETKESSSSTLDTSGSLDQRPSDGVAMSTSDRSESPSEEREGSQEASQSLSSSVVEEQRSSTPNDSEAPRSEMSIEQQSTPSSLVSSEEQRDPSPIPASPSVEVVEDDNDPVNLPSEPSIEAPLTSAGPTATLDELQSVGDGVAAHEVAETSSQLAASSNPFETPLNFATNPFDGAPLGAKQGATEAAPLFGAYPVREPSAPVEAPSYNPFAKFAANTFAVSSADAAIDSNLVDSPSAQAPSDVSDPGLHDMPNQSIDVTAKVESKKRAREEMEDTVETTKRRKFADVCDNLLMKMPTAESTIEDVVFRGSAVNETSKAQRRSRLLSRLNQIESTMKTGLSALNGIEASLFRRQDGDEEQQFHMGSRTLSSRIRQPSVRRKNRYAVRPRLVLAQNEAQIAKLADISSERAAQLSMEMRASSRTA